MATCLAMPEEMVPIFAGVWLPFAKVFGVRGFFPHPGIGRVLHHAYHVVDALVTEFVEGGFDGWGKRWLLVFRALDEGRFPEGGFSDESIELGDWWYQWGERRYSKAIASPLPMGKGEIGECSDSLFRREIHTHCTSAHHANDQNVHFSVSLASPRIFFRVVEELRETIFRTTGCRHNEEW